MRARPAAALLLGVVLAAASLLPGEAFRRSAPAPPASHAPVFDHIFVILEENQDYRRIIGNPELPFINRLITDSFLQTDYHGLDHGSLPDYLGLVSGSEQLQAIGSPPTDCLPGWAQLPARCVVTAPQPANIGDLLERDGRSWRAYLQGMGWPCRWQSATQDYEVIHNPFVYFQTVEGGTAVSSRRCVEHDVDMYADVSHSLPADLASSATTPNFLFIVPINRANMHDDRLARADHFLQDILTGTNSSGQNGVNPVNIFASPAWTKERSILYVVWDEDAGTRINHVVALAAGNWVNGPRGEDGTAANHYSLLRTWEVAFGLPPLQLSSGDGTARPLLGAFNLLDGAAEVPIRLVLPESHREVFARVEAAAPAGTAASLLGLQSADGLARWQLSITDAGRLVLRNGIAGTTQTSAAALGPGWHSLQLHVDVAATGGTCEVDVDGQPLPELSQAGSCVTGVLPIGVAMIGDPTTHAAGIQLRHPALATSRIDGQP